MNKQISKPKIGTVVRVETDWTDVARTSLVSRSAIQVHQGTVIESDVLDEPNTFKLLVRDSTYQPIVPMSRIVKIEVLGKDSTVQEVSTTESEISRNIEEEIFHVKSKTSNNIYTVTRRGSYWRCDCPAGSHGKKCWHISSKQAEISNRKTK